MVDELRHATVGTALSQDEWVSTTGIYLTSRSLVI